MPVENAKEVICCGDECDISERLAVSDIADLHERLNGISESRAEEYQKYGGDRCLVRMTRILPSSGLLGFFAEHDHYIGGDPTRMSA